MHFSCAGCAQRTCVTAAAPGTACSARAEGGAGGKAEQSEIIESHSSTGGLPPGAQHSRHSTRVQHSRRAVHSPLHHMRRPAPLPDV